MAVYLRYSLQGKLLVDSGKGVSCLIHQGAHLPWRYITRRKGAQMAYRTYTRDNKRYLGNSNPASKEVHDLLREDRGPGGCQIDELLGAIHGAGFYPDSLIAAHAQGYNNCAKCIGSSKS